MEQYMDPAIDIKIKRTLTKFKRKCITAKTDI